MLPRATEKWTRGEARHLLNRAGFGGSPREVDGLYALGREDAVDWLLDGGGEDEDFPVLEWASEERFIEETRERMEKRREVQKKLSGLDAEEAEKLRQEVFREIQRENRRRAVEGQGWWFRRMLVTEAPLREKMTLFWHDHFATSIQKVKEPELMMRQNGLFRDYAIGGFRELTHEVVRDPAMMLYLDTQRSSKAMPNENFARELMELFTLGEGNYTEEDVREAARAFTGFKLNRKEGTVVQSAAAWDDGVKTIFGKSGAFNGKDVVNLIFKRDECADFMVRKVWEFFAYEGVEDAVVAELAATFRDGGFEMRPLLREIFLSREFYGDRAMGSQVKSPVQYLVQMLKELEVVEPPMGLPMMGQTQLGQVLLMPPNVAGWDWGKAWINTNTLLTRYNIAGGLIKGKGAKMGGNAKGMEAMMRRKNPKKRAGGGASAPDFEAIASGVKRADTAVLVDALAERFFSVPLPEKARGSFIAYADSKRGEGVTDRELAELCHLMLSTPYYQLC